MNTPSKWTDAALIDNGDFSEWGHGKSPYVHADFARRLERLVQTLHSALLTRRNVSEALRQYDSLRAELESRCVR